MSCGCVACRPLGEHLHYIFIFFPYLNPSHAPIHLLITGVSRCSLDAESLAHEFQLYGSVQGTAVGSLTMKCLSDLDEAAIAAADAVQLKPIPASSAAPAVEPPRSVNGSNLPSVCK